MAAMTIAFDGREYAVDDFTLGELEWLEEQMGCSLDEINASSMKAAVRFVYLIKRREDPEFTLDQARNMKLSIFNDDDSTGAEGDAGAGARRRPTKAKAG